MPILLPGEISAPLLNINGIAPGSSYHQGPFQYFTIPTGSIPDAGNDTYDFQASGDPVWGLVHVKAAVRISNNSKLDWVEWGGSYCLDANVLTDNNFALIHKDGAENVVFALTAVGANDRLRLTLTNNGGDVLNYGNMSIEFLTWEHLFSVV